MTSSLLKVFSVYKSFGVVRSFFILLRIFILPFWKIDRILPKKGLIVDIGCGEGGISNYLYFSNSNRKIIGIDISKERISRAKKTQSPDKNVQFINGDITKKNLSNVDAYILIDVLHHIKYTDQDKLLSSLYNKMKQNSLLLIKDVDNSNTLPFLFGHLFEKILYPKDKIYTRNKNQWISILSKLGFSCSIEGGTPHFPDSTLIFTCNKS